MRYLNASLLCLLLVSQPVWSNQTDQALRSTSQKRSLTGQISVMDGQNSLLRLNRDDLNQKPTNAQDQPLALDTVLKSRLDQQAVDLLKQVGSMDKPRQLAAGTAQTQLDGNASSKQNAPYIWAQSRDGGYYDASGTYKDGVVMGDRLHLYGGKFADGTPVPTGEVTVNEFGHVFWQNGLRQPYFWQHR